MRKFNTQSELLDMIRRYVSNRATSDEKKFLEAYYEHFDKEDNILFELSESEKAELEVKLENRLMNEISQESKTATPVLYLIKRIAVAALILVALSISFYLFIQNSEEPLVLAKKTRNVHKIVPGGNRALLTLADGSKIDLDGAVQGEIARQAGIAISKTADGRLVYTVHVNAAPAKSMDSFNTIETPRGGQYQITLPDGTRVWLNAASTLRYPTSFTASERKVELDGEAYFEVAENRSKPFRVISKDQVVEVLGTQFNVSSYGNESSIKTTLVEGSVKVLNTSNKQARHLLPGQEAVKTKDGNINVRTANIEQTISWKNGLFVFNDMELKNIMRQLERWYDVEVDYATIPNLNYNAHISRELNLSEVLQTLEVTGSIKFIIENRTIKISNQK